MRRLFVSRPGVLVFIVLGLVATSCAHRMSTDELLAANSQVLEGGSDQGAIIAGNDSNIDGTGTEDDQTSGDTSATAGGETGGSTDVTATNGGTTPGSQAGSNDSDGDNGGQVGTPGQTGPIVIGSVGNYSGIAGPPQAPMARAVQIWADYINSRGGLFGRQVQVIVVDDRGDPAQHVAALRDLVENRGAVAFVSNAGALTVASGRNYLESAGVPVIGTACANTTEFESSIFFPQCEDVREFYLDQIRVGVEFGGTAPTLGILACSEAQTCNDGFNALISQGKARQAGADVVYSGRGSLAQPDFTSECRAAAGAGEDDAGAAMMYVLLDPTGVIRFGQSCARQGYNPLFVQGSATVFYDTKDQPGLSNLIIAGQVFNFIGTETPARQEFQDVMASFYGKPPGPAEAYGWASAKVFEEAAFRAARDAQSITPETLIDALHTFKGETLGGLTVPLTFPAGKPAQPAKCAFAARAQNGEWKPLNGGEPLCR